MVTAEMVALKQLIIVHTVYIVYCMQWQGGNFGDNICEGNAALTHIPTLHVLSIQSPVWPGDHTLQSAFTIHTPSPAQLEDGQCL